MTPAALDAFFEGRRARTEDERAFQAWAVWHQIAPHVSKPPKLKAFIDAAIGRKSEGASRATAQELESIVRQWAAVTKIPMKEAGRDG